MKQELDTRRIAKDFRMRHWAAVMMERKDSGQSIRAWCRGQGISEKTYYYWQRKLRESACETMIQRSETAIAPAPGFAEISVPDDMAENGVITVQIGDSEIKIAGEASPVAIETVLRVMMSR